MPPLIQTPHWFGAHLLQSPDWKSQLLGDTALQFVLQPDLLSPNSASAPNVRYGVQQSHSSSQT